MEPTMDLGSLPKTKSDLELIFQRRLDKRPISLSQVKVPIKDSVNLSVVPANERVSSVEDLIDFDESENNSNISSVAAMGSVTEEAITRRTPHNQDSRPFVQLKHTIHELTQIFSRSQNLECGQARGIFKPNPVKRNFSIFSKRKLDLQYRRMESNTQVATNNPTLTADQNSPILQPNENRTPVEDNYNLDVDFSLIPVNEVRLMPESSIVQTEIQEWASNSSQDSITTNNDSQDIDIIAAEVQHLPNALESAQLPHETEPHYVEPGLQISNRIVWITDHGAAEGVVKWIGQLEGMDYAGIQFERRIGNTNGKFNGQRYFACETSQGRFVPVGELMLYDDYYGIQDIESTAPGTGACSPNTNSPTTSRDEKCAETMDDDACIAIICVICQESLLGSKESLGGMITTKCGHLFHTSCLNKWFSMKPNLKEQDCPYCKEMMKIDATVRIYPVQGKA